MEDDRYPPIGSYGLIADGHSAGLVSRRGSIDWLCIPRIDSPSCFARLLDHDQGGWFSVQPVGDFETTRRYRSESMVLETTFETPTGTMRLIDCIAMRRGGAHHPLRSVVRVVEGVAGTVDVEAVLAPRLEYGRVRPWIRPHGDQWSIVGGNSGLVVSGDMGWGRIDRHTLGAEFRLDAGDRRRVCLSWADPERAAEDAAGALGASEIDDRLEETALVWRTWCKKFDVGHHRDELLRSALVLKAMTNPPTGAIAAAPTTSLPEAIGGPRNWDYRYSWLRDSAFTVHALGDLGFADEAGAFRSFVERSAAGDPKQLQIMYGLGGEVRLHEHTLELEGYRGSRPVRIGNDAFTQRQLDAFGYIAELSWEWAERGEVPDEFYWQFLCDLGEMVCERWTEPDRGIWEVRGEPLHFVHSKAMCWAALDHLLEIAARVDRDPHDRWVAVRAEIGEAIEEAGYDDDRGVYVRSFGSRDMDAALLLLPRFGYVAVDDDRMIRTTDAIREDLEAGGHIMRYRADDGLESDEGTFVACTFWMAEVLSAQRRHGEARRYLAAARATANDLGLFSEEYDSDHGLMLGNFPLALSHMAHIGALLETGD